MYYFCIGKMKGISFLKVFNVNKGNNKKPVYRT